MVQLFSCRNVQVQFYTSDKTNIQDICFKGSTDVDVLLQICVTFRNSFLKEHLNSSHVNLHIKDQNTA